MASLITIFRDMPDPRSGNAQRHALLEILAIALSVCDAESCVNFAEDREPLLRDLLSKGSRSRHVLAGTCGKI